MPMDSELQDSAAQDPAITPAPVVNPTASAAAEATTQDSYAKAIVDLEVLFDRNPAYGRLYAALLLQCQDQVPEENAAAMANALKNSVAQTQDGASIVSTLVRKGGVARTILVDGQVYAGTMADLQSDESIPQEATVEFLIQTTQAGIDAAEAYLRIMSANSLLAQDPQRADGFLLVIKESASPEGSTTAQLQEALIQAGIIKPGIQSAQELHASYFTSKLEQHGALVWDRKRWRATQEGRAMLDASM